MLSVLVCVMSMNIHAPDNTRIHVLNDPEFNRIAKVAEESNADLNDPSLRPVRSSVCQAVFGQGAPLSWIEARTMPAEGGAL